MKDHEQNARDPADQKPYASANFFGLILGRQRAAIPSGKLLLANFAGSQ